MKYKKIKKFHFLKDSIKFQKFPFLTEFFIFFRFLFLCEYKKRNFDFFLFGPKSNYLIFGITFGCIDGTHIPLKTPRINSQYYFNCKEFYSIIVQAICDSGGLLMDIDCHWRGLVHNAKVF